MKILKIRFKNIHSLKGEHEVNFAEGILAEAGLFAITGPTGSGKSTLLDVITLALFNRIARVDKTVSNSILEDDGGIMTRNMKSCFAEVEYRVNGNEYRSHWSIERNRNNNLNARKQELVAVSTGEIIESGTKTPEKNKSIIGLSYEQFVKAMVLSQGEFSKLLQAPRNERNKLLEDITGARSYRNIGRAVYLRYKTVEKEIDLKEVGLEGIQTLPEEIVEEKQGVLANLNKVKPQTESRYNTALEKIKTREARELKEKEKKEIELEALKLKEDFKVFIPYKSELEKHEKLSKYAENIRDFEIVKKEVDSLNNQINKLKKSKDDSISQQKKYLQTISELIKEPVSIANANEKLETFRDKISTLEANEENKKREATLYQKQLNSYVEDINNLGYMLTKALEINDFSNQINTLQRTVENTRQQAGVHSLEALNKELINKRAAHEKAGELLIKKEQYLKVTTNLQKHNNKLKTTKASLTADSKKAKSLEDDILKLKKEIEALNKKLEQQRKHQNLEAYRQQLIDDEPCPLCGSTHHPYAFDEPYFDANEALLNEKKDAFKSKSDYVVSLVEKRKFQQKEIEEIEKRINADSLEAAQLLEALQNLNKILLWNLNADLNLLKDKRVELSQKIENLEKSKRAFEATAILKNLKKSLEAWEQSETQYSTYKKQRTALYDGNNINELVSRLSTQLTQAVSAIKANEAQSQEYFENLNISSTALSKHKNTITNIVNKENLENFEALKAAILPEQRASKIRNRESELKEKETRISEKKSSIEKTLLELLKNDDSNLSKAQLTDNFNKIKVEKDELLTNIGKISQQLEDDKKAKKRQQQVLNKLKDLRKDLALWKTMNDLIGDATGNKFSNFVQDLTLEQLIGFANKRLLEFSDRYLLDIPTAKEADKSDTLKIFDKYMGNARRSVKTLSGGETFLLSLAMAFALSDIAAKNVKIESLFIDEGFGTLDPETLDQAINILEKMQNESDKSVGVISHVSALKERITTQIKLDKGSLGYSTLAVEQ